MSLSAEGARVFGSLLEKSLTTPQQYPLTLPALIAACNRYVSTILRRFLHRFSESGPPLRVY